MAFDSQENSESLHKNPHLINNILFNTCIASCFGTRKNKNTCFFPPHLLKAVSFLGKAPLILIHEHFQFLFSLGFVILLFLVV